MAVVALEGKLNGATLVFRRGPNDTWTADIPPAPFGIYVIEVTAIDEAGNRGSRVERFFFHTPTGARILPLDYVFREAEKPYGYRILGGWQSELLGTWGTHEAPGLFSTVAVTGYTSAPAHGISSRNVDDYWVFGLATPISAVETDGWSVNETRSEWLWEVIGS